MSDKQPTLEILQAFLAAFNRHDLDAIMEFFCDDCIPACRMFTTEMTGTLSLETVAVLSGSSPARALTANGLKCRAVTCLSSRATRFFIRIPTGKLLKNSAGLSVRCQTNAFSSWPFSCFEAGEVEVTP